MRAVYIVFTTPNSPEKEADYNEWYDKVHIPAILKLDGFVRVSRWKLSSACPPADALGERPYLAIYELEADDLSAALINLKAAADEGKLGSPIGVLSMDPPTMTAAFELVSEIER